MLQYPQWLSPDVFSVGPVTVRWYGLMYLLGFLLGRIVVKRLVREGYLRLKESLVDDFLLWLFIGMVIGARLAYMLVYFRPEPGETVPWWTFFAVWQGGLAAHGAVIGMCAAIFLFARIYKLRMWNLTDALALAGSQGIIWGRFGNFINAELLGRVTDSIMGMHFPVRDLDTGAILGWTEPRHPSQLYQAFGEGLLPFAIIWLLKPYIRYEGVLGGIWVCLYASARFVLEFFREKDKQLEYYFGWMTMGQILCALMFAIGVTVVLYHQHRAQVIFAEPLEETQEQPAAT